MAVNTQYNIEDFELAVRAAGIDFGTTINESDIRLALREFGFPPGESIDDSDMRRLIREYVAQLPDIKENEVDPVAENIISGQRTIAQAAEKFGGTGVVDPDEGVTDTDPVNVGGSTIPQGGRLIRVRNPEGADAPFLYFIAYDWRGVQLTFEVGDPERFRELFGSADNFESFQTISQAQFDDGGFVEVGSIDQELGATESIGSRIERETRTLGFEDLPAWMANAPDALALVATGTAQEWSSGRIWQELSTTPAFRNRYGDIIDEYRAGGAVTIGDAVRQINEDEARLRTVLRPYTDESPSTGQLHQYLRQGWTPQQADQVLTQAEVLRRDPEALTLANTVLEQSGLDQLDDVEFINALAGFGPQDTIEALNTATAARALEEAGIDLSDEDLNVIMEVVDTSDRLLTAESWQQLSQQLSLNLIRFNTELDQEKLGAEREDLIAAAFGREAPSGKSAGEVLGMLARFERDRRAAGEGFEQTTSFLDDEGQLRIAGRRGL